MEFPRILISILNWNKASTTLQCVESLRALKKDSMLVEVIVIDNGSALADYEQLCHAITDEWIRVYRIERNLGFTGGHNVALAIALEAGHDFVWMLNNDTIVRPDTLVKLVRALTVDTRYGAVSPVILPDGSGRSDNAWGLVHDWAIRRASWIQSEEASRELHETRPDDICLSGTAILLRTQAMREIGLLDDRLFAYYDDNDVGVRLARAGWRSKIIFNAVVLHDAPPTAVRPLYFFYLMFRNELVFWHNNMPSTFRRLLWLKLVNQSIFNVLRLRRSGMHQQADVALLGIWDFICGRWGAPELRRKPPLVMRAAVVLAEKMHRRKLL